MPKDVIDQNDPPFAGEGRAQVGGLIGGDPPTVKPLRSFPMGIPSFRSTLSCVSRSFYGKVGEPTGLPLDPFCQSILEPQSVKTQGPIFPFFG